jgi:hypothetical protein
MIFLSFVGDANLYPLLQTLTLADLFHIPGGSAIQKDGCNPLQDEKRPNVVR